jgi:hypothetical protein
MNFAFIPCPIHSILFDLAMVLAKRNTCKDLQCVIIFQFFAILHLWYPNKFFVLLFSETVSLCLLKSGTLVDVTETNSRETQNPSIAPCVLLIIKLQESCASHTRTGTCWRI